MRALNIFMMSLILAALISSMAIAGDQEDVEEVFLAINDAYMRKDAQAVHMMLQPSYTTFGTDNSALKTGNGTVEEWQTFFDNMSANIEIEARDISVQLYGNMAVATGLEDITLTQQDGTTAQVTYRSSEIFIKENGKWLRVHLHISPLDSQQQN
jgi:ketosteroid isomerase-like protein